MKSRRLISLIIGVGIISVVFLFRPVIDENDKEQISREQQQQSDDLLEKLISLPYVNTVTVERDSKKQKVTVHKIDRAFPGYNLLVSRHQKTACLLDMAGEIVHHWSEPDETGDEELWLHADIDNEGNLVLLKRWKGLFSLDWDSSECKTISKGRYHHDLDLYRNNYYLLSRKKAWKKLLNIKIPISSEYIVVLNSEGETIKVISLFDIFKEFITDNMILAIEAKIKKSNESPGNPKRKDYYGLFHSNAIEVVPRDLPYAGKGDLLVCLRNINLVAVIDLSDETIRWSWGQSILDMPHDPAVLENGNLLVFDNGWNRKYSRVLEYDPQSGKIIWEYKADPPEDFFTKSRGGNQRLPNGNTLITESNKGRVFEVDQNGETVWEFWNPVFNKNKREVIYRMVRYEPEDIPYLN